MLWVGLWSDLPLFVYRVFLGRRFVLGLYNTFLGVGSKNQTTRLLPPPTAPRCHGNTDHKASIQFLCLHHGPCHRWSFAFSSLFYSSNSGSPSSASLSVPKMVTFSCWKASQCSVNEIADFFQLDNFEFFCCQHDLCNESVLSDKSLSPSVGRRCALLPVIGCFDLSPCSWGR
uniref:Uncharacterized protein n=1 Tax=Corvus moneduloides TaxID=1196302 RepID=A0A8C3GTR2_CORMO